MVYRVAVGSMGGKRTSERCSSGTNQKVCREEHGKILLPVNRAEGKI